MGKMYVTSKEDLRHFLCSLFLIRLIANRQRERGYGLKMIDPELERGLSRQQAHTAPSEGQHPHWASHHHQELQIQGI